VRLKLTILNRVALVLLAAALSVKVGSTPSLATNGSTTEIPLSSGWSVTQDVRQFGERQQWFDPKFEADWQPIDRLVHLQLIFAKQPYFGRELRYFNESAWWYRLNFETAHLNRGTTLRFEGVDYFAKVWLNGILLGEHEGYADPFEFEVGKILRKEGPNVLVVKVSSPWDHKYREESPLDSKYPYFSVERNLMKGSYEHADTFVQRDVNPIGIWRPVNLLLHDVVRTSDQPQVSTELSADHRSADVHLSWPVVVEDQPRDANLAVQVREKDTRREVARFSRAIRLKEGTNVLEAAATISSPKLWTTWDRGTQLLYEITFELTQPRGVKLTDSVSFGVRSVELHRSSVESRFFINGKPIYIRGTTYWPDLYLSNMSRERYERDIKAAIRAGFNALRVHVHTENPEFYEICDRLGIILLQDNDLSWVFPTDAEFSARAVRHFGKMVTMLRNHPSVIAWVAMNEVGFGPDMKPGHRSSAERELGSKLVTEAHERDPTRPVIENSMDAHELASGDTHDYRGSLDHGTYFDIVGSRDNLVTEFGVDAPPSATSLRGVPEVEKRLADVIPRIPELQSYQYQLLKFYVEHYRIQKYSPNGGYFQFMWIDFAPQSFYGIYDYWGVAKTEGLGGGLRALQESNQPIGIFMEHDTKPSRLYAVNDSSADLGNCIARWRVTTSAGVIAEDSQRVEMGPDSLEKIRDLRFAVKTGETYKIELSLVTDDGQVLANNVYLNPFQAQPLPDGYPDRIDDELGVRLWWSANLTRH